MVALLYLVCFLQFLVQIEANCLNNGTLLQNGTCKCNLYFSGESCQLVDCQGNGYSHDDPILTEETISNLRETPYCYCMDGWNEEFCQQPQCEHGYLHETNESSVCICNPQWEGIHCNSVIHCVNGKKILSSNNITNICECNLNWEGELCDQWMCYFGKRIGQNECQCYDNGHGPHCIENTKSNSISLLISIICGVAIVVIVVVALISVMLIIRSRKRKAEDRISDTAETEPL